MQDVVVMRKQIVLICFLTFSVKYHLKKELADTYPTDKAKRQGDGEPNAGIVSLAKSMLFSCSLIFSLTNAPSPSSPSLILDIFRGVNLYLSISSSVQITLETQRVSWPYCNVQKM